MRMGRPNDTHVKLMRKREVPDIGSAAAHQRKVFDTGHALSQDPSVFGNRWHRVIGLPHGYLYPSSLRDFRDAE